ncbi:GNAT family N-acetyltransferase [Leptospira kanakyensis]|uniref:GNAT family N-acetyltransferase n=1 Tax=Leptospira kanakyensis TaxID=2484968 RepID=A0A6N4QAC2_9LEPT|nr:GNAT family N-acetyltransferase [Leptospira kanakyensis]MCW7469034.1 GNAT family N-acetyltransferase [Leptospira kanakyensis]TGK50242.1 GNAT family N-acetyltransferase [Leptospira kanakyensis]TGK64157.1 GNAT family N-acetyltransferase [Leptospira kanakyensis]TGK69381.1 GNAT family N-acetyltransferase [Leptospira kanakyensis]
MFIRDAHQGDAEDIFNLIKKKAEFDRSLGDSLGNVTTNVELIKKTMFGVNRFAWAIVAVNSQDKPIGIALCHTRYSSFSGLPSIWLDDLFIFESFRGSGLGKDLMEKLIEIAISMNASHIDWVASNFNEKAKSFYSKLGGIVVGMEGSTLSYRLRLN